jgi:hypothetical protein
MDAENDDANHGVISFDEKSTEANFRALFKSRNNYQTGSPTTILGSVQIGKDCFQKGKDSMEGKLNEVCAQAEEDRAQAEEDRAQAKMDRAQSQKAMAQSDRAMAQAQEATAQAQAARSQAQEARAQAEEATGKLERLQEYCDGIRLQADQDFLFLKEENGTTRRKGYEECQAIQELLDERNIDALIAKNDYDELLHVFHDVKLKLRRMELMTGALTGSLRLQNRVNIGLQRRVQHIEDYLVQGLGRQVVVESEFMLVNAVSPEDLAWLSSREDCKCLFEKGTLNGYQIKYQRNLDYDVHEYLNNLCMFVTGLRRTNLRDLDAKVRSRGNGTIHSISFLLHLLQFLGPELDDRLRRMGILELLISQVRANHPMGSSDVPCQHCAATGKPQWYSGAFRCRRCNSAY